MRRLNKSVNGFAAAISIIVILIIVLASGYLIYKQMPSQGQSDGNITIKHYLTNGNCDIAVVYITYQVSPNSALLPKAQQLLEMESPGYYSTVSFYEKYGIHMHFSYFQSSITSWPSTVTDDSNGDAMAYGVVMIAAWAQTHESLITQYYSQYDQIMFITQGPKVTNTCGGSTLMISGDYFAFGALVPNPDPNDLGHDRYVFAHEIGHSFGGRDHYLTGTLGTYESDGNSYSEQLNDAHCLMNLGGDNLGHLTKGGSTDTIFGAVDIDSELHLNYIVESPLNYWLMYGRAVPT
jgi:hypothetical protein